MANGYAPPDEPETPQDVPDEPEAEAPSEGAQPAKISQAQANYREGNPQRSCGLCGYFDSKQHACDRVEGEISPFGFSRLYQRQDNPFRQGETGEFTGGVKVAVAPSPMAAMGGMTPVIGGPNPPVASMTQGPPQTSNPRIAQTGVMQGPAINGARLRIGNKSYAG